MFSSAKCGHVEKTTFGVFSQDIVQFFLGHNLILPHIFGPLHFSLIFPAYSSTKFKHFQAQLKPQTSLTGQEVIIDVGIRMCEVHGRVLRLYLHVKEVLGWIYHMKCYYFKNFKTKKAETELC